MENAAKQFGPRRLNAPGWTSSQQFSGGFSSDGGRSRSRGLPPPVELAGRIEEARTSAKLLLQLVQSTPPNELIGNELVKEFSERCTSAQRSIQGYIACDNPAPDDDTMLTLIETNEQLSLAASKHQRAVLQARRATGASPSPTAQQNPSLPPPQGVPAAVPASSYTPPPGPPPRSDVQAPSPLDSLLLMAHLPLRRLQPRMSTAMAPCLRPCKRDPIARVWSHRRRRSSKKRTLSLITTPQPTHRRQTLARMATAARTTRTIPASSQRRPTCTDRRALPTI